MPVPVPNLAYALIIMGACSVEMLLQDTAWTISTKAVTSNKRFIGALFNSLGDGLGRAISILTTMVLIAAVSRSVVIAQVGGDMLGAFVGVYTGNFVSVWLDKSFAGYHRHPLHSLRALLLLPFSHVSLTRTVSSSASTSITQVIPHG